MAPGTGVISGPGALAYAQASFPRRDAACWCRQRQQHAALNRAAFHRTLRACPFRRATYLPGNRTLGLERDDANFIETLERLHKSDGNQAGWILLVDGFASSLVCLSLSATLLWTRLAGPRLLSAGLALGSLFWAVLIASRVW